MNCIRSLFLPAVLLLAVSVLPAAAQTRSGVTRSGTAATASAPNADKILHEMSAKLAGAKTFGFTAQREIDPGLLEGLTVPEKARVVVLVQRPNKFAAEGTSTAGTRRFVFDGKSLSLYESRKNVFATVPLSATLDGFVDQLDEKYGFVPPLAEFALSNPYAEFRRQAQTITYLGRARTVGSVFGLGGIECHRLELKGKEADAELWVGVDDLLPRKLVATFHRAGNPQLRVNFATWNLAPRVTGSEFTFTPPAGAQKIEMWTKPQMAEAAHKH